MHKFRFNSFHHTALLLAALLIIGLYWFGLNGPFLLDDLPSIENAKMHSFSLKQLIELSFANDTGPLGRPVAIASFVLNDYFLGSTPFSFKSVNLAIHLFMFLAVFCFINLICLFTPAKRYRFPISFLTALVWASHPLLVSTVLYSVQRMTQWSHLFILFGLNAYLFGRLRLITHKPYTYTWMWIAFGIFFPLSLLSKETGILFPWYVLIVEFFILRFRCKHPEQSLRFRQIHYTLSLALLFAALIYYWRHVDQYLGLFAEKNITVFDRILTQIKALVFYLRLILLPDLAKMGLYHDDFAIARYIDLQVSLCLALLLCLCFGIYYFRKRQPILAFGLTWFFISHVLESTALPLEMVFEHRNYLACVGILFIPLYYGVVYFKKQKRSFKYITSVTCLLIFIFSLELTYSRTHIWSSLETFLGYEAYYHPFSPRTHIELANWSLNKGDYNRAFIELETAQVLEPLNTGISLHKVLIMCRANNIPEALYKEAEQRIQSGRISPYTILVLDTLVENMFQKQCDSVDKNKIIQIINHALANPFLTYKPEYKATLYHLESGLYLLQQNLSRSLVLLSSSFKENPKRLDPLIQKAYLEMQFQRWKEAHETLIQIQNSPHYLRYPSKRIDKLFKDYEKLCSSQGNFKPRGKDQTESTYTKVHQDCEAFLQPAKFKSEMQ